MRNRYRFDNVSFDMNSLRRAIYNDNEFEDMKKLLSTIITIDNNDMKQYGVMYKHVIYTETTTHAKLITGCLMSLGLKLCYNSNHEIGYQDGLQQFGLLTKGNVYQKPLSKKLIKKMKTVFNTRPENVYGKNIRIMVIDGAYKEGLDLFDVKYMHIVSELSSTGEEKQVVGRALRNCGHSGLPFSKGWKLFVYHYKERPKRNKFPILLGAELARICYYASVDFPLTYNVHEQITDVNYSPSDKLKRLFFGNTLSMIDSSDIYLQYRNIGGDFKSFRSNIENQQQHYWDTMSLTNNCVKNIKFSLNPTQNFVKDYFRPVTNVKGMLLWHSAGSGKTCTGLAVASTFAKHKFNILWVTRASLIPDIYKNAMDCYKAELPDKNWIRPMSYKTFTNMLNGKNQRYQDMRKRNKGNSDLLKNTLLIIDEAHKLFDGSMPRQETPDVDVLLNHIKTPTCRMLLMTATPLIKQEMILMKLLNMVVKQKIPDNKEEFKNMFLDNNNQFTDEGAKKFIDTIYKNISYLDLSKDLSRFAMPIYM